MATTEETFHVRISPAQAHETVVGALPDDAVKRDEEDGVGRFAGERTVCMLGRRGDALLLFEGTWRDIKHRLDEPMLHVQFAAAKDGGTDVTLKAEVIETGGAAQTVSAFISNALFVGVLYVAWEYWRAKTLDGIDMPRAALIGLGGGAIWTAVAKFLPGDGDESLSEMVRGALSDVADPDPADDGDDA